MRPVARFFILFLIALLPLRGWSVQHMAFAMQGSAPVAAVVLGEPVAMPQDCVLHQQATPDHASPSALHGSGHPGCQACQLCMPLAALECMAPLLAAASPQARPMLYSSCFASADPAHTTKPPIS